LLRFTVLQCPHAACKFARSNGAPESVDALCERDDEGRAAEYQQRASQRGVRLACMAVDAPDFVEDDDVRNEGQRNDCCTQCYD
jgi:hypothetical protein